MLINARLIFSFPCKVLMFLELSIELPLHIGVDRVMASGVCVLYSRTRLNKHNEGVKPRTLLGDYSYHLKMFWVYTVAEEQVIEVYSIQF